MARKRSQPKSDPTACVIYARFSSERQRDESIEDQVRVCSDWAAGHGLTVVAIYEDRAISGTSDGRPEFLRMISDARSGNFGTVLVYKLDRFARDRFDAAIYRKRLGECGVELRSAMESIPDGPEGAILESVIDGFNEYYSRNLSQNVLRGMMGNAERCLVNGVRVYGYRTAVDGTYEADEAEARFVRGAFERAASGMSRKEIVAWLNSSGSRNTRGNRWQYNSVRTLLLCEKYRGVYSFNGVRVEGGMPRLVSDELWEAAQATMTEKPRQFAYLLAGKLFDGETGRPYRGTNGTSSNKRTYLYYSVPTSPHHERRFQRDAVERAVLRALASAFADRSFSETVARAAVLAMEGDADSPEVRAARARLEEVGRRESNILRAVEMGVVPPGTDRRLAELSGERARLEERLSSAAESVPTVEEMAEWVRTRLAQRPAEELLRNAVSRCTIDAEDYMTVEIPWRSSSISSSFGLSEAQKIGEPAASGMFSEFRFGSPYQIRTGDLRLERVIPQRRLRTTDLYKRASEQVFCSDEQRLTEPDENGVPVAVVSRLCPIYDQATGKFRLKEIAMNHSAADIDAMCALEDYSHFRAELVEISPESFTIEGLREILDDMIRSKVALEDSMREHFATLGEAEQTELLDMLRSSGYKDRSWWYRMLMDGPVHREFPTI